MENVNENNPFLIENLCPGEYTCQIFDGSTNEVHSICFSIEAGNFEVTLDVENVQCFGENNGSINVEINGGTPPYTYEWDNGEITQDLENLSPGWYTITVIDNLDCVVQESVYVEEPSALDINYQLLPLECGDWDVSCVNSCDGSMQINVLGGEPPYNYVLIQNNLEISGTTNSEVFIIDQICEGDWIFGVYDSNGCTNPEGAINLTFDAPPEMEITYWVGDVSCYEENEGNIQDGG